MTAGTSPSRTSENANVADSAATTTSQAASSPTPPARAGPRTTATTGFGEVQIASSRSGNSRTPWSCAPPPAASARSMPGAEDPAGVVEHDHPHGVVGEGVGEGLPQLGAQGPGERVAVGGGVQGQRRDAARHLHLHHSVGGHSRILPGRGGRAAHWEQMNTVLPLLDDAPPASPLELPDERPRRADDDAVRPLRARAVLRDPLRLLRLQHLHLRRAGPRRQPRGVRRHRDRRAAPGGRRRSAPTCPTVSTVFVGGGTPTLLPADDLAAVLAAARDLFPVADDVEVTTEANPESVDPGVAGPAARGRVHADQPGHAVRRRARARRPGPPAHARPGGRGRARGPGGRVRARQPRPDLRRARRDRRRLGRLAGRRPGQPGRPRERLRADRRGRHPAGPPDRAAASCRCPTTTSSPTATRRPTRPSAAAGFDWYEVSNWATSDARPLPAQRAVLGQRQLVGRSARARTATSAACAGGTSSTRPPTPTGWPAA